MSNINNSVFSLNAEATVFSPMSKLKMDVLKMKFSRDTEVGLEKNNYEEGILIKKIIQRTEMGSGADRRSHPFIEYCRFCKNNGEKEEMYLSHVTKESGGNVQCPVLRNYTCPRCGETGDKAHTVSYCPKKLRNGVRRMSEDREDDHDDPRIPTPMVGHLINRMMLERAANSDREL